jgi:PTS system cellobiose-specific IIC component
VPSEELRKKRQESVDRLVARLRAFAESPEMVAIRRALPISFIGLFIGLGYFMATQPAPTLLLRFSKSFGASFGVMSLVLVVVLSVILARARNVSTVASVAIALAAFTFSQPFAHANSFPTLMKALGSSGLFLAIGIAVISVDALWAAGRKLGTAAGTLVAGSLVVGVAALLMALGISLTHGLNVAIAPLGDLGDSLTALLIIALVETLLWTIGIHGPALLAPVVLPVYINLQVQNTEAFAHNQPLPHIVTVSMFLFVFPGGAGGTFSLVLLLLRSRVKRIRTVALATLLPSFANANEPLMFGLPLVLNPVLSVPFVVVPLVLSIVSWWAMNLNLVARPAIYVPSPIPLPIGGFLATKDWRSVILTLLNVAIAAAIYAPFVRIYERQELAKEELIEEPA